jgi:flagellum-specific ATP synthase
MTEVVGPEHLQLAGKFRSLLAVYKDAEDLINIGAYAHGSNPRIDLAIKLIDGFRSYLQQETMEKADWNSTYQQLKLVLQPPGEDGNR